MNSTKLFPEGILGDLNAEIVRNVYRFYSQYLILQHCARKGYTLKSKTPSDIILRG